MKPVPFVLETEGTYEAPLINIFNDSTLIHVSKAVLPFPGSSRILREDEDVTTDWCDVNFGENRLSPILTARNHKQSGIGYTVRCTV